MIHSLLVENIALIDKLNIEFAPGLNVLTGETGAGKSIIVNSMNLVLGERADRDMIRNGRDSARVEAILYLDRDITDPLFEKYGIQPDEEMIISRELSATGKNTCRINGSTVNLSTLKAVMDNLVDMHGQHEHQSLLYAANHIKTLDNYGGDAHFAIAEKIRKSYSELSALEKKLSQLGGDASERKRTIDLLEFQINELTEAGIQPNETEELKKERDRLANAQAISLALNQCYDALYSGENGMSVVSALRQCADRMEQVAAFSDEYSTVAENLNEHRYSLEELAHDISAQADTVVFDEQRQAEVEERIEFINSLERKYGVLSERELIEYIDSAQDKLESLINSDKLTTQITEKIADVKDNLYKLYEQLSIQRKKTAHRLSGLVIRELCDLGMKDSQFEVRFADFPSRENVAFTANGADELEFFISTNAGEPLKPLAKVASGGEISRIMLAFKNISAVTDNVSTLIFDEIDTGISGGMALVVAKKMAAIAKHRQVISVTHLPQIAAMADKNFLITKSNVRGSAVTEINQLDEDGLVNEIARLSGGIKTENAYAHAKELLENARQMKKDL